MVEKRGKIVKIIKNSKINFYRRQQAPEIYDINASIYIWKRSFILKSNNLINKKTGIFVMPKSRSIDIDDRYDFDIVKFFFKKKRKNELFK